LSVSGVFYRLGLDQEPAAFGKRDVYDGSVGLAIGLGKSIEAFGRFNAALYETESAWPLSPRDGVLGAKMSLPGWGRWLRTGVLGRVNLPWGKRERGFSTDGFDPALAALFTVRFPESSRRSSANLHINLGYQWHQDDRGRAFEGWPLFYLEPVYPDGDNDRIDLRAAFEFASERSVIFAELLLDHLVAEGVSFRESPRFFTPGFRYALGQSFSILVASKIALASDDPGTTGLRPPEEVYPDWQIGFALSWTRSERSFDQDGDGVPDFRDRCLEVPEDRDGWADHDGCPEPDNDGDGIPDGEDGAPDEAEDFDGWADVDGIPDPDNDRDGVPDEKDGCPNRPEDRDGIEDEDGCPEAEAP
jgi:hypothetical protein